MIGAKSWPQLLPEKGEHEAAPAAIATWSRAEVEAAQARCTALLKSLDVVAVPEAPLREDTECGTPAPYKLISIGRSPQIAFSPPPTVTCDMVAALHKWLERDVQPLARKHLGAPVIRIQTMSSYSCRNAYGRANSKLSEHGRANAVDIGSFVTATGQAAMVVADWGMTAREIKAAAAKGEVDNAQAQASAPLPAQAPVVRAVPPRVITAGTIQHRPVAPPSALGLQPGMAFSIPGLTIDITGSGPTHDFGLAPPNRLGGPKTASAPITGALDADSKMDFLRNAHSSACKVFGTVLGPEANSAHKNHFHVDMAQRRVICE